MTPEARQKGEACGARPALTCCPAAWGRNPRAEPKAGRGVGGDGAWADRLGTRGPSFTLQRAKLVSIIHAKKTPNCIVLACDAATKTTQASYIGWIQIARSQSRFALLLKQSRLAVVEQPEHLLFSQAILRPCNSSGTVRVESANFRTRLRDQKRRHPVTDELAIFILCHSTIWKAQNCQGNCNLYKSSHSSALPCHPTFKSGS